MLVSCNFFVGAAENVAKQFGVSPWLIGLTVAAIGTSLPELATACIASLKGHGGLVIGNVLGSNIFNLLGVLGITALVTPVPFADKIVEFDLWVLLGVTLLLVLVMLTGRRISRPEAALLLALYGVYVASQFWGLGGALPVSGA